MRAATRESSLFVFSSPHSRAMSQIRKWSIVSTTTTPREIHLVNHHEKIILHRIKSVANFFLIKKSCPFSNICGEQKKIKEKCYFFGHQQLLPSTAALDDVIWLILKEEEECRSNFLQLEAIFLFILNVERKIESSRWAAAAISLSLSPLELGLWVLS